MKPYTFSYPLTRQVERAAVLSCCTDPAFWQQLGRHVEIEGLSNEGVDEAAFVRRAPGKLAMAAVAAICRRGRGPTSTAEVLQELRSWREEGKVTQEEQQAVQLMLDEVSRDTNRPAKATLLDQVGREVRRHLHQQALIKGMDEWGAREGTDGLKRRLAVIDSIGSAAKAPQVEIEVDVVGDLKPEKITWLSPGRIAYGKLTNLIGDPGVGKSLVCCEGAAAVTRGRSFLGGQAREPAQVMVLSDEDGVADTLLPRLLAAGADVDAAIRLRFKTHGILRLPELNPDEVALVEKVIVERGVRLVVLDPVADLIPDKIDADTQRSVRRVLALLRGLAERTGAAVICVIHLNKNSLSGNALHRSIGSIAYSAVARSVLLVARDPAGGERRVLARAKCTNAPPVKSITFDIITDYVDDSEGGEIETQRIVWGGESDLAADDLLAPPEDKKKETEIGRAVDFLKKALAGGPRLQTEVEDEAVNGELISRPTLRRAKVKLGVISKQQLGVKNGPWMWALPNSPEKEVEAKAGATPLDPLIPCSSDPTDSEMRRADDQKISGPGAGEVGTTSFSGEVTP